MEPISKQQILEVLPSFTVEELDELAEELDELRWQQKFRRDAALLEAHGKELDAEHAQGLTEE